MKDTTTNKSMLYLEDGVSHKIGDSLVGSYAKSINVLVLFPTFNIFLSNSSTVISIFRIIQDLKVIQILKVLCLDFSKELYPFCFSKNKK